VIIVIFWEIRADDKNVQMKIFLVFGLSGLFLVKPFSFGRTLVQTEMGRDWLKLKKVKYILF